MKIETNISKNYFLRFDEARGIAFHKKNILRNKQNQSISFIQTKGIFFILLLILSILFSYLPYYNPYLFMLPFLMFLITFAYLVSTIVELIGVYHFRKKQNFKNIILIDKNGVTDQSYYGIKMTFAWNKITGVVVGRRTVTILTDTPIYFYFDISKKDDIIKAVEKYGKRDLIIE